MHLCDELQTTGPLIVGLGSENVLETGLRLHQTYGVPLIPGSALKGLCSHYCDQVFGQRHLGNDAATDNKRFRKGWKEDGHEYHKLIFGETEEGGVITFHDAWITPPSLKDRALRLDVMTPHHPKWQTNNAPPTDFDSPIPVTFLSVAGTFVVRLSWSGPRDTAPEQAFKWTQLAMAILKEALAESGVGGKTSSGYGRLIAVTHHCSEDEKGPESVSIEPPKSKAVDLASLSLLEVQLLKEKTNKDHWKGQIPETTIKGAITNSANVPSGKQAGHLIKVKRISTDIKNPSFQYLTDDEYAKEEKKAESKPRESGKKRGSR